MYSEVKLGRVSSKVNMVGGYTFAYTLRVPRGLCQAQHGHGPCLEQACVPSTAHPVPVPGTGVSCRARASALARPVGMAR